MMQIHVPAWGQAPAEGVAWPHRWVLYSTPIHTGPMDHIAGTVTARNRKFAFAECMLLLCLGKCRVFGISCEQGSSAIGK